MVVFVLVMLSVFTMMMLVVLFLDTSLSMGLHLCKHLLTLLNFTVNVLDLIE
jgi:hypothetical protein